MGWQTAGGADTGRYYAFCNAFYAGAAILLLIFSLWQMLNFYAIAIFHFNDYQAANIPVLLVLVGQAVIVPCISLRSSLLNGLGVSGYKVADGQMHARLVLHWPVQLLSLCCRQLCGSVLRSALACLRSNLITLTLAGNDECLRWG